MNPDRFVDTSIAYDAVEHCPACGGNTDQIDRGRLANDHYYLGASRIPALVDGEPIRIKQCATCGLVYKNRTPSDDDLARLFDAARDHLWRPGYDYRPETTALSKLFPAGGIDVLDVGAHDGALLRALAPLARKRSAMDIYRNPRCDAVIDGEYIVQALDDVGLSWTGERYDLVTMYDVAEHMHDVGQGFTNLASLVRRDGYIVIETGDTDCHAGRRHGLARWWYLDLLEHHVAYSAKTIDWLAARMGFEVVSITNKQNKEFAAWSPAAKLRKAILLTLYTASRKAYESLRRRMNQPPIQPPSPFARDHLLITLRRG